MLLYNINSANAIVPFMLLEKIALHVINKRLTSNPYLSFILAVSIVGARLNFLKKQKSVDSRNVKTLQKMLEALSMPGSICEESTGLIFQVNGILL